MKKIYLFLALLIFVSTSSIIAQCDSDAGTMPSVNYNSCYGEDITVAPSEGVFLEADDILQYIAYLNPTAPLDDILVRSANPTFSAGAPFEYNTTCYYVAAIVGNDDGTGNVDLTDPCLSISNTQSTLICFGELTEIDLDLPSFCIGEEAVLICQTGYTFITPMGEQTCQLTFNMPGIYEITIATSNGSCVYQDIITVLEGNNILINIEASGNLDCENSAVILDPVVSGGSPPFEFTWSDGSTLQQPIIGFPGFYSVTVSDVNGCFGEASYEVVADFSDCASIEGVIAKDENNDCLVNGAEIPLSGRLVSATGVDSQYYGYSDENGEYYIPAPLGTYEVQVYNPNPIVWQNCPSQTVVIEDTDIAQIANFALQPLLDCPLLSVDLSTWAIRPCLETNYSVQYCNDGTVAAADAYIEITFDELIEVLGSSLDYTFTEPNLYRFDVGTLDIGECGNFQVTIQAACGADLGLTACSQAIIYPHEPCEPTPSWNGASVAVTGECTGDEVIFNLQNIGTGNMDMPLGYIVIEDGVMLSATPIDFELEAGEILPLAFAANGSTYTVQAMQVAGHPGFSAPTSSVEACGTNDSGEVSQGFVLQFPLDENDNWAAEDCRVITGSYDPNDKQGFPRGYGDNHFIEKGQDLEYLIRFQNTGTDTAFTVRIDDVLAPELDITTIRPGASSHPYELNIRGADTLEFLFENILLPDSFVNEVASNGFVQFKISQRADLELGTIIENTAGIYFDFNEPIITNTTFHELGEMFVEITRTQNIIQENLQVEIAPNPVNKDFTIHLSGAEFQEGRLEIFDVRGQLISVDKFTNATERFQRKDGIGGVYFYKIYLDNEFSVSGKIVFTL